MFKYSLFLLLSLGHFDLMAHGSTHEDLSGLQSSETAVSQQAPTFSFKFPDIELFDHRNNSQALNEIFAQDKNVVFAFFFSHCVSICTTTTLTLQSIQPQLPPGTLIAMISIDPETDTPELLGNYAKQFKIEDPNWYLLTGSSQTITDLQKSFEAYSGNKMNHNTSLFVKKSGSHVITEIKRNFSEIPNFLHQKSVQVKRS
jgi:cytochrome oxidase Cu insertion factor (SCO1/SenC/PrrC family)